MLISRPVYIDLEGADLTGKTTLLRDTFRNTEYSKILCFHDRGILTHFVYNELYGRYLENQYLWLDELVKFCENNGMIILVARNEDTLRKRFEIRNDDHFKQEEIIKVNNQYIDIYEDFLYQFKNVRIIEIDNKTQKDVLEVASVLYRDLLDEVKK